MPGPGPRNQAMPAMKPKKGTLGRLLKFIFKFYKKELIIVFVCITLSSVSSVFATFFMQRLIDECIIPGMTSGMQAVAAKLFSIIATMAIVYATGTVCQAVYAQIMANVTQGTLMEFRNEMFNRMQTYPIKYFDTHAHGDIMSTYTNDTDAIRQLIGQSLPNIFQSALSIITTFAMMLYYSIPLTGVVIIVCIIIVFVIKFFGGTSSKYMMAQQRSLAKEEGFIEEMIQGQKVVKVFNHETIAKDDFAKLNQQLFEDGEKANIYGNILMPILHNIGNILYVVLAIVGGFMVFKGSANLSITGVSTVTIGIIVSFLSMSRQLSQTIGNASNQVSMIAMGLAGAGRIFELIDEQPEKDEGDVVLVNAKVNKDGELEEADKTTSMWAWKEVHEDGTVTFTRLRGHIEINNLHFSYVEGKEILHDITLYAKPGEKVAFVGATGAGKTTITNLINRFYDIDSGEILYDGIDIRRIKKDSLRRSLGVVLQEVNLFTGTVMENIRYGRLDATDAECKVAARLANADDFIKRLPQGYDTVIHGNGSNLSQGQRQLISIARAAVADPPVMILDEATSSIDTRTEALVQAGMDNLMKGRTVFVIAHRLSTVRNSEAIMVLDHGKIIERGTHDYLIDKKGTYYQLYTGAFELD